MIVVSLDLLQQPCDNCGHDVARLEVGHTYVSAGRTYRFNRVQPCGCALAVVDVTVALERAQHAARQVEIERQLARWERTPA